MRLQFHEKNRPEQEYDNGNAPVSKGNFPSFPEPDFIDEAVAISLDEIKNRVDLENNLVFIRNDLEGPENRRAPE